MAAYYSRPEANPSLAWRLDAVAPRHNEKTCFFVRFFTCSQNTKMAPFSLMSKVFGHV